MSAMTPVGPVQAIIYEQYDSEIPITTKGFQAGADIKEGIGGLKKIDTTFENVDYELQRGGVNEYEGGGAFATKGDNQ